jgi:hypothetical protein
MSDRSMPPNNRMNTDLWQAVFARLPQAGYAERSAVDLAIISLG